MVDIVSKYNRLGVLLILNSSPIKANDQSSIEVDSHFPTHIDYDENAMELDESSISDKEYVNCIKLSKYPNFIVNLSNILVRTVRSLRVTNIHYQAFDDAHTTDDSTKQSINDRILCDTSTLNLVKDLSLLLVKISHTVPDLNKNELFGSTRDSLGSLAIILSKLDDDVNLQECKRVVALLHASLS